jgi:hypothetical protein
MRNVVQSRNDSALLWPCQGSLRSDFSQPVPEGHSEFSVGGHVKWGVELDRLGLSTSCLCVALAVGVPGNARQTTAAVSLPAEIGVADEGLRRLFTPSTFPAGTFKVHRSAQHIETLAAALTALDPSTAEGAWLVERAGVFDAFGSEGPYDKPRLALLFGGSSPSVARGTLVTVEGRLALTLIEPYPDAALASLRQGTMVIVTKLPRH